MLSRFIQQQEEDPVYSDFHSGIWGFFSEVILLFGFFYKGSCGGWFFSLFDVSLEKLCNFQSWKELIAIKPWVCQSDIL